MVKRFCGLVLVAILTSVIITYSFADMVFLVYTDTHFTYPSGTTNTRDIASIAQVNTFDPAPVFIANAGDMAEAGLRREYDAYKKAVKEFKSTIALYEGSPGNHDMTRGMGALYYRERIGAVHSNFTYDINGKKPGQTGYDASTAYQFLILNEGMLNHGDGWFPRMELNWIKDSLDKGVAKNGAPVVCFFHHPTNEKSNTWGDGWMVGNDRVLTNLLKDYNVRLMLYAHVHIQQNYTGVNDNIPAYSFDGVWDPVSGGRYGGVGYMTVSASKVEVRDYPTNGT